MQEELNERFFAGLPEIAPPAGLCGSILALIERKRKRAARIRLAVFSAVAVSSFAALIPTFRGAWEEASRSGASHYLSLLFSDSSTVLLYWREFILTLAESLPVFYASIFLGTLFALLTSLRVVAKNIHTAFLSTRYTLR